MSALVVVVFRLILEIRALGRFHSIPVAFGFLATGIGFVIILGRLCVGSAAVRLPPSRSLAAYVGSWARTAGT